jgi:asparagine synthase (glutamine-hydrolysing)
LQPYFSLAHLADQKLYEEQDKMQAGAVAERFGSLFGQSVQRMLMSDAPMGVFLSGGVDSSLIAAVAAARQKEISFFTANVVGPHSEVAYARQVAGHLGKTLYEAPFENSDMPGAWVDATYHYEAPLIKHANSMPFARVAGLARQQGVKAVLTGEGSDELFLGYPGMVANKLRNAALLPLELLEKLYMRIPGFANNIRKGNKLTLLRIFDNIIQDFHKQHVRAEVDSTFHFLPPQKRKEQSLTLLMLTTHLASLLWRNDRMGMMHSIESRFPFLDESLLRFAANLPLRFKVRNEARLHNWRHPFQVDKWVVRQMAAPLLPHDIVYKPKKGFPTDMMRKVQVEPAFFANGFVQELFGIASPNLPLLKSTTDQYTVAKFAAMDIWGRLFVLRQPVPEVKELVLRNALL